MEFQGKCAIVTGAASGMGLLFSQNFASLGGNVVMCDVNKERLAECAKEINAKKNGRAVGMICNVRNYTSVRGAVELAKSEFGGVDVAISFAGGYEPRMLNVDREKYPEFPDIPIEVFDWGLDVNLKGPFYLAHAALGAMRAQRRGVIINIGSVSGVEGSAVGMAYPTAKAGLMYGLTKSIALYGAEYNVRCVCISPGPVLTRDAMANMDTLLGRAADPQEIVDLCLYVASDKGAFINGENIMIDGGRSVMLNKSFTKRV